MDAPAGLNEPTRPLGPGGQTLWPPVSGVDPGSPGPVSL